MPSVAYSYTFRVSLTPDLQGTWREEIWQIFEHNMKSLYVITVYNARYHLNPSNAVEDIKRPTLDGTPPKNERRCSIPCHASFLFGRRARAQSHRVYLRSASLGSNERMIAMSFTGELLVYATKHSLANQTYSRSYEMQTKENARRLGLGRALVSNLQAVGRGLGMTDIMLTVFIGKLCVELYQNAMVTWRHILIANAKAQSFYEAQGQVLTLDLLFGIFTNLS